MAPSTSSKAAAVRTSLYEGEQQLDELVKLIDKDLSEPYSVFTYRYFLYNWPNLCLLSRVQHKLIGAIVCRREQIGVTESQLHEPAAATEAAPRWRGYIAMLAVDKKYRKQGIGSGLVKQAIDAMIAKGCDEIMLETEVTNKGAIRLYENLGFVRDERLVKYYLNGNDAFRLKLWLR
ncbi:TPA: hypothetical protein N0F65_004026 [Lagenidium giganteum]|uniref:N-acetyltransferase domain-containing protein n=1 Tax=Lagenidium giganteum TaxID=4803 RepID=A0AAV2YV01_9STRA|nr:TPA: hypothetical protein N0F65_004026 [Lagenidium giganteum]